MLASASLTGLGTGVGGRPRVGEARMGRCSGSTPIVGAFFAHERRLKSYVSRFIPHAAGIDDISVGVHRCVEYLDRMGMT